MPYQPLRCWSADQRRQIEQEADALWRAWRADWGIAPDAGQPEVRCTVAEADPAAAWTAPGSSRPGAGVWWQWREREGTDCDPADVLLRAMFDCAPARGHVSPQLARELADAGWTDLWRRIGEWLGAGVVGTSLAANLQPWSGSIVLTLPWPGSPLRLLVAGTSVAAWLEARAARTPAPAVRGQVPLPQAWDALSGLQCEVALELQPVELTVGAMRALRVGDVVELNHLLDAPLLVRTEGQLLCEGFLGKAAGRRAVELVQAPARPHA